MNKGCKALEYNVHYTTQILLGCKSAKTLHNQKWNPISSLQLQITVSTDYAPQKEVIAQ